MSEIGQQYMAECPECGATIDVHPNTLGYVADNDNESGCDGTYEYDIDICICPSCGQRFVRISDYLPVPKTYSISVYMEDEA